MIIKIVRNALGYIFVLASHITLPKPIQRNKAEQRSVAQQCESLSLYQFYACPFCVKTRRAIYKLNIPISYKNAQSGKYREELEKGGGRVKVPCLKIETANDVTWMYESSDIIKYLQERFG